MRVVQWLIEREAGPDCGRPGVGISLNALINGAGLSIVLWGLIFKALGLW